MRLRRSAWWRLVRWRLGADPSAGKTTYAQSPRYELASSFGSKSVVEANRPSSRRAVRHILRQREPLMSGAKLRVEAIWRQRTLAGAGELGSSNSGQSSRVGQRQSAAASSQLLTRPARSISASTSGSLRLAIARNRSETAAAPSAAVSSSRTSSRLRPARCPAAPCRPTTCSTAACAAWASRCHTISSCSVGAFRSSTAWCSSSAQTVPSRRSIS